MIQLSLKEAKLQNKTKKVATINQRKNLNTQTNTRTRPENKLILFAH
jgi:hypothetical protein